MNGDIATPGSRLKLIVIDEGTLYTLMETVELVKKNESYVIKIENDFLINQVEYTLQVLRRGRSLDPGLIWKERVY